MKPSDSHRISSEWLAAILVAIIVAAIGLSLGAFNQTFTASIPVTLQAPRSGLVMEPYAKVRMRGVQVGRVATVSNSVNSTSLQLDIDPDQINYIPANVEARINATTLFGAKFVDLVYPSSPSAQRLSAGAVLTAENVAVEVNTVFQNLVDLIKLIDPAKLNSVLSALAQGVGGQGQRIGDAISDTNDVLLAVNPRSETLQKDWRALKGVADTYGSAAQNILGILSSASTTSQTVTSQAQPLDSLLLSVTGLSRAGVGLLGPSKDNLIRSVNQFASTTGLLMKYNPELTCLLVGANKALEYHIPASGGVTGKSLIMDATLMFGDDPYRYPDNLPITNAKGGAGGTPSCGSLPDVAQNWPVRYLVTDTGFGNGLDNRPNPGIGFPGYADYFPVTRAVPEPPSIRYGGGPAPGPYPGAPPFGPSLYRPDGTPLFAGTPPPETPEGAPTQDLPSAGPPVNPAPPAS